MTVWCGEAGARALVRVMDTGPGIRAEERERVFDRFFRGRPVEDAQSSTAGLGLSIARRIVELHEGELTASSRVGGGSEFTFSLRRVADVTEK